MGNPLRGEAQLVAGELGTFTLVLRTNALAEIQAAWGLSTGAGGDQQFLDRLFTLPVALHTDLRLALYHALQARHGEDVRNAEAAGVVIDAAGLPAVRKALTEALTFAFPETAKDAPKGGSPPKGQSLGAGSE